MKEEENKIKPGRPWKNESYHASFEEADAMRNKLLRIWEADDTHKGMQVKVRFMSSRSSFVVKTRLHPDFTPVGKKNDIKRKSKNRRNNKKRESVNQTVDR